MKQPVTEPRPEPTIEDKILEIPPLQTVRIRYSFWVPWQGYGFLLGPGMISWGWTAAGGRLSPDHGHGRGVGHHCLTGYGAEHLLWRRQTPAIRR